MGWGEAHTSPEADVENLRSELDACKTEIDRLRVGLLDAGAELAEMREERDGALELLGPRGVAIANRAARAEELERHITVARHVAFWHGGWSEGSPQPHETVRNAVRRVLAAIEGETDCELLGVEGIERERIESMSA